ncbi:protein translocase component YidC [Candidatus Parcubacteria bacterium]|nr:MAG: protein translocase component YidC [Candidatus Parcubacteria bacterium]
MSEFFNAILYQPILNVLVFLYNIIPGHDIGLAIVLLTVIIKLILYPFSLKSIKSQKALQEIQPKIEELKKKFSNQKEKLAAEMMRLYREEKVSPFSSCLPLLIQLPFLLAVYQVFRTGLSSESLGYLYPFIENPGRLESVSKFFFSLDMARPNIWLAVLTGIIQFWQSKMMITKKQPSVPGSQDEKMLTMMNRQMLYFMPIMTVFIGFQLPSGLVLYWLTTTLLMILQQYLLFRKDKVIELKK